MPLTAPLHVPRRPASRSVTQALPRPQAPSEHTPAAGRAIAQTTPKRNTVPPSGMAHAKQGKGPGEGDEGVPGASVLAGMLHGAGESMELQSQLHLIPPGQGLQTVHHVLPGDLAGLL